jgi:hypothetical protein
MPAIDSCAAVGVVAAGARLNAVAKGQVRRGDIASRDALSKKNQITDENFILSYRIIETGGKRQRHGNNEKRLLRKKAGV